MPLSAFIGTSVYRLALESELSRRKLSKSLLVTVLEHARPLCWGALLTRRVPSVPFFRGTMGELNMALLLIRPCLKMLAF